MSPTATDRAYKHVKQRILDGRLPGGDLISEGEVADQVRMSRTPVREAFLRLESEGLLRLYPRRGALVVPVSRAEVADVIEARKLVELHAVERLITSNEADLAELERLIETQEELAEGGDTKGFVEADGHFHRAIVSRAGNAILADLHESLRDRQLRMGLVAIARDSERIRRIIDEHRGILEAITDRDVATAKSRLKTHLEGTLALL